MRVPGRRASIAASLLLPAAVAGWLGVTGLQAQRDLVAARLDVTAAQQALADAAPDRARTALSAAAERTTRARSLTDGLLWRLAAAVPLAGRTPATARGLAVAADDLVRDVLTAGSQAAEAVDLRTLRGPDGAIDVAMLRAATAPARRSAQGAQQVREDLRSLPSRGVVRPVADARLDLLQQLDGLVPVLRGAAQALELAPVLLGDDRRRRYLLLVQQTGESRGTGGLIGGYALVEAAAGRLVVADVGSNADLRAGPVEPAAATEEFARLYGPSGAFLSWQNANLSPDVPAVAKVLEARWIAQGGSPLDGVVLLDAVALAHLLGRGGPVELGDRSIAPAQLPDYLAVGQYADFAPRTGDGGIDRSTARKDRLEEVAGATATALTSGSGDTKALLLGLADALRSGHLRMASDDAQLAAGLRVGGVDGALTAGGRPLAAAVVNNASGGKLDHFLDRRVSYTAGPCRAGRRSSVIDVELRNDVPDAGLPPYLTTRLEPGGRVDTRTSSLTLTVYTTPGSQLVRATVDGAATAPEDPTGAVVLNGAESGLPFWTVTLDLPPGQQRSLRLELDEPVVPGRPHVPEQPLSRPLVRHIDTATCA